VAQCRYLSDSGILLTVANVRFRPIADIRALRQFGEVKKPVLSSDELIEQARRHSVGNRKEVEASRACGCFSCVAMFKSKDVVEWHDEWGLPEQENRIRRWSAVCPDCGKPTVLGDASGLPVRDTGYLSTLRHIALSASSG
jgi:hypothetical protein